MSIKKIALKTGLSKTTVSMILNKKSSPLSFSEATKKKVMEAAKTLNYQPSYLARSLSTGKRFSIGIAGGALDRMDNPTISRIYSGIGEIAKGHEYNLTFFPMTPENAEEVILNAARSKMVDGLILIVYSFHYEHFSKVTIPQIQETGTPVVAITSFDTPMPCPYVGYHAEQAGYLATEHLISRGIEKTGFIGFKNRLYNDQLYTGYLRALSSHNLKPCDCRVDGIYRDTVTDGEELCPAILRDKGILDGYVVFSDFFAQGLINTLEGFGKKVPDDVLVTGIDNGMNPAYSSSQLTSVDRKSEQRGAEAARMLFTLIEKDPPEKQNLSFITDPELIVRKSTTRR